MMKWWMSLFLCVEIKIAISWTGTLEFWNFETWKCGTLEMRNLEFSKLRKFETLKRYFKTLEFLNVEMILEIVERRAPGYHEDPSNYFGKSWIWDQYLPETWNGNLVICNHSLSKNMKWNLWISETLKRWNQETKKLWPRISLFT